MPSRPAYRPGGGQRPPVRPTQPIARPPTRPGGGVGVSRPGIGGGGNVNVGGGNVVVGGGNVIAGGWGTDVNVNVDHGWGYGGYAAGVATGAAIASIGSTVTTIPTSGCWTTYSGGVTYYNCNGTYYQPYYDGATVVYQVVSPPM